MFVAQGIYWYFRVHSVGPKKHRCADLTKGKRCRIWKGDEFRPICRYWPFHPDNIKAIPECGFRFKRVKT